MIANTIEEVLNYLDKIISEGKTTPSAVGYFAALYKKMTLAVKEGIQENHFDDGPRMEQLDVVFANRYLAAYVGWKNDKAISASWKCAFDAVETNSIAVIQHLLLGINAHINLDLGIAVAKTSEQFPIENIKNDYNKINEIIGNQINTVQAALEKIFYPMRLLDRIDNKEEKSVLNFCILIARNQAWNNAIRLSALPESQWLSIIRETDQNIALLAKGIIEPGILLTLLMKGIQLFESANISKNINAMNGSTK